MKKLDPRYKFVNSKDKRTGIMIGAIILLVLIAMLSNTTVIGLAVITGLGLLYLINNNGLSWIRSTN